MGGYKNRLISQFVYLMPCADLRAQNQQRAVVTQPSNNAGEVKYNVHGMWL